MGALHEGHLALIRAARRRCDRVVVSIFVNPTQFGPTEDFEAYPRDLRRDRALSGESGAHVVFTPSVRAVYPEASRTTVSVPSLQRRLCGARRPGHFDGVCLVVAKLLNMVRPDELYLGQKDAQQAIILTRMIRDLDFGVRVRVVPTVRERDGLAMSSRNAYLTDTERRWAPRLYQALKLGRGLIREGERDPATVMARMRERLSGGPGRIDYLKLVDARTLEPLDAIEGEALLALAVFLGRARLIDNVRVRVPRGAPRRRRTRAA